VCKFRLVLTKLFEASIILLMKYIGITLVILAVFGVVNPVAINAAYGINRTINFSGKLVNASGVNVPNSTPVTVTFSVYETNSSCPGGGTAVWSENQTFTPVDGIFQVALGSQTAFGTSIDFSQDTLYLGIQVSGETNEMCSGSSRIKLAAVPFAFNAESFAGLTADNNQTGLYTITGGQGTPVTLNVTGNISVGSTITPTAAGGLTVQSNGDNSLVFNSAGTTASALDLNAIGTVAGNAITLDTTNGGIALTAAGTTNGDITLSPTDDFNLNGTAGSLINIGTSSVTQTISIGAGSNTDLTLSDAQWSVTGLGVATFSSGTVLGSTTFTTNNIADSGALTIKSAAGANALTLDSGTVGSINIGTGVSGKTISIGTDNTNTDTINIGSLVDDVAITSDQWSISNNGILVVQSCIGCGTSPQTVRRLGANYTNATTGFTTITDGTDNDDQDLTFQTGVSETWVFEAIVYITSAAAADMKFQVTAPANATCKIGFENSEDTVNVSNIGCGTTSGQLNSDGAYNVVRINGTVVTDNTNSGKVSVQFGQFGGPSGTSTIQVGSYIIAEQVGAVGAAGGSISLTGDVTGSGTGSIVTTIEADKVLSSMILNGTIVGEDLATDIAISTTGNLTTTGAGTITSAGAFSGPTATNTINGLVINSATQTLMANSISDTGALTVASGVGASLTLNTANNGSGSAGNINLDVGTSLTGNGEILIGTAARNQDITIGNSTGGTISIGESTGSDLVLTDTNWGVTGAGVGTLFSLTATTGNVVITNGDLVLGVTTRVSNAGVGTFASGTVLGSQTFTTNNITDSGSLAVSSAAGLDLTLKSADNGTGGTGDVLVYSGDATTGTAGDLVFDVGTSTSGNGSILIGTGAWIQNVTIGNSSGGTITLGGVSGSDLVLQDADWGVTGTGAVTAASLTAGSGNIAITAGNLTFGGSTRINNFGVGTFISGTVIGSQTFTTNNISDTGSLTIKSADGANSLTLDSGTVGTINLGTGTAGKTINIGTDNTTKDTINIGSNKDDVAITGNTWSISSSGVLTVSSCIGCGESGGSGGVGSYTARLAGDYTNNTASFTDVDDDSSGTSSLSFPIGADETWIVEIIAQFNSPTGADAELQMTCPAGASGVFAFYEVETAAQVVGNVPCGSSSGVINTSGTDDAIEIRGTVVNGSTAGEVQFQFRQSVASGTSTIYAGSYIVAEPENEGGTITLTGDVVGTGTNSIVTSIGSGKVTSSMILDTTISGSDLASDIGISTSGNLVTTGGGTITSAGAITGPTTINTINGLIVNGSSQILGAHTLTDSGALAITSALGGNAITVDSGSTGDVNLGTGSDAKTISIGTGTAGNTIRVGTNNTTKDTISIGSDLDDVAISAGNWSISSGGVLTVQSCVGCSGVSQTPWLTNVDADNFSLLDLGANITSRGDVTFGSADNGSGSSGEVTVNTGSGTTGSGGLVFLTGDSSMGTAGSITLDVGSSALSQGSILIGTAARAQDVTIGNTSGGLITVGAVSGSGLVLQDADWGVSNAGTAIFTSLQVGTSSVVLTLPSGMIDADAVTLTASGTTGLTVSRSGLESNGDGLALLMGCDDNQILKWTDATGWACQADNGTVGSQNETVAGNWTFENAVVLGGGLEIANGSTMVISDGTNDLVTIKDQGTYAYLNLSAKTDTGDPVTCAEGDIYYNSNDDTIKICHSGNTWESLDNNADWITAKRKTADVAIASDNTVNTDADLFFYAGASQNWIYRFEIMTRASGTTPDIKFNISTPASPTYCRFQVDDAETANTFANNTCNGAGVGGSTLMAASDTMYVSGSIDNGSTAGNVSLQWAQNTSSTQTLTVYRGSFMEAFRVQGADLAEFYNTDDPTIKPGDVVALDPAKAAGVKKTEKAYDPNTLGIVSTKPGLAIGDQANNSGGKPVPVALSGRVPVKVTLENGEINPGDYLTSSSIPGVAMKATKAGVIVGQALTSYAGPPGEIGTVLGFIKNTYSLGSKTIKTEEETQDDFGLLNMLVYSKEVIKEENMSEIITDRLVAGLEVVTPMLRVGEIFADKINVKQIEGWEGLMASTSAQSQILGQASDAGIITITPTPIDEGLDFTVFGDLVANNAVTVFGPSKFLDKVDFKNLVSFEKGPIFNKDTVGFAKIKQGSDRVDIVFDNEYLDLPVVTVNINYQTVNNGEGQIDEVANMELEKMVLGENYNYFITRKTRKGFTIILNKKAVQDIDLSWTAFAVKDSRVFSSVVPTGIPVIPVTPIPASMSVQLVDVVPATDSADGVD